jgi:hypothetical protein
MTIKFSMVLPVFNQADHIESVVGRYRDVFRGNPWEIILVPNACRDQSTALCRRLAMKDKKIRVVESERGGWGLAVRLGLAASRGSLIGYANSARTDPESIPPLVQMALENKGSLVKASRHRRGHMLRELGSAIYNFECRLLLGTGVQDVNGTPKIFPATLFKKMKLFSDGDLLDAELMAWVHHFKVPVYEMRQEGWGRFGGKSTTSWKSALRMYRGVLNVRKRLPW